MKNGKPHRRSTIAVLDPRIRAAVDAAIREDRASIDEILALIKGMGASVSRSAVGRYAKNTREQMKDYIEMQALAKTWMTEVGKQPEGNVGKLLLELVKTLGVKAMAQMKGEDSAPMDLMLLGKMIDHVARADKALVEREVKIDALVKARMASAEKTITAAAKRTGASPELIKIVEQQLGILR